MSGDDIRYQAAVDQHWAQAREWYFEEQQRNPEGMTAFFQLLADNKASEVRTLPPAAFRKLMELAALAISELALRVELFDADQTT